VFRIPGGPGSYRIVMRLSPHYQLDRLTTSLRLSTSMATRKAV
jgi:predicted component of type VI protein secretion system